MPGFLDAPIAGAYHLVTSLVTAIEPLTGQYSAVVAIVLCTLAVRLLLLPLSLAAHRGEQSRTALLPQLRELSEKHRDDPDRLKREMADLQQSSGTTVLAGCLPMLAQLPFFWLLYTVFSTTVIAGQANQLLAGSLLGLHWPLFAATPAYLALAVLLGVVAWLSSRRQVRRLDESATPLTRRITRLAPFGTLATAAFVPPAAGLYLLITTTWTLVERSILQR
ncbi:YidC/Oxa1 family membrane protein insertase [Kribbella amoyensis]|uniref:Membrane protein insertase YidC n=1 Tax=Kribbella amoyensis TaxID=996641 RepID=A0A561BYX3_9ACTN|nr:membrane protein insertase YidC [Kribbella amoyensis]TWD84095.1 YidC/Oxa1 family membrane protein insertase [Kribbella amoyensis]